MRRHERTKEKFFFENIRTRLDTERIVVFLGDFNCVCSARDKSSDTPFRDSSILALIEAASDYCLEDVGDALLGVRQVHFTHFQGTSHARLDRAYVSLELLPECGDYCVSPVSFSDHCLVSFTLGGRKPSANTFNWSLWKMNSKLLQEEEFTTEINEKIRRLPDRKTSWSSRWEIFKQEVKLSAIEKSSARKYRERQREQLLRKNLASLTNEESQSPGSQTEEIKRVKSELEVIDQNKYHGALVRARAEKLLLGEAPTKRALTSEKRYACRNHIVEIENHGVLTTDRTQIEGAFKDFYEALFSVHKVDADNFRDEFLNLMPRIEDDMKAILEMPITINEILSAIDDLTPGKTPGPDGLSACFYKAFKDTLSVVLCEVYAEAYENNRLPPSFTLSHTVLIPKTEDAIKLRNVRAYCPISLSNVDYKILMKVLAARLQLVVKEIVGPHQTCGIKGRSITTNTHVARSILECSDSLEQGVAMVQIDLEKAFDKVSHELLLMILEHTNVGKMITDGVRMAYRDCSTSLVVNKSVGAPVQVSRSVRQGCPLSSLLFCMFIETFCVNILKNEKISGFSLQSCEVRVLAYADDIALFFQDTSSIHESISVLKRFCLYTGSSVNWDKCIGFWHGSWLWKPHTFAGISWVDTPVKYLGVPLENYRDSDPFWRRQATEIRDKADKWGGKQLSVFARATVCNLFFVSKLWYVMQVLHCSRANVQRLHRVFAVFIWCSTWERTSRTNLFRRVRCGGLSLAHLFLRQVVNRFLFLRDVQNPFLRTVCQVRLGRVLPEFVVTSCVRDGGIHGYLREVVLSARFLFSRFSFEYLATVHRKKLYRDLLDTTLPTPLYRSLYSAGPGQDVCQRVKKMTVPPYVKSFFFKLHVGVLPVKTWMIEKGLFVPWGPDCLVCKKPETVEHAFIDCWDGVFLWDVLQRTLKKDFPLDSHGIRFLAVENYGGVPYDLLMLLALHSIWKARMAVRHNDVDVKPSRELFCQSVREILEVYKAQPSPPDWLNVLESVAWLRPF